MSTKILLKKIICYFIKPKFTNSLIFFSGSVLILKNYTVLSHAFLFSFILAELWVRLQHLVFYRRKNFKPSFFLTSKDIPFEPHPYLPWVMKKNWSPRKLPKLFEKHGFMLNIATTDEFGLLTNDRRMPLANKIKRYKILILGDSVSFNYVSPSLKINYPNLLQKQLDILYPGKYEVINGACFAYTTQEILINYLFNLQYLNPDMVFFYGGYADIRAYFTKNFSYDFRHFRNSVSPRYEKLILISSVISSFNSYFIRTLTDNFLYTSNLKSDFIKMISKETKIDILLDPSAGLQSFETNILSLIYILQGKKIPLILSTYCHHLNSHRLSSTEHVVFNEILKKQNDIIRCISNQHNIKLIDNFALASNDEENFQDEVHFSLKGMELIVDNFIKIIKEQLSKDN